MGNYLCVSKKTHKDDTKAEREPVVTSPRFEHVQETGAQPLIVPAGASRARQEQQVVVTPNSLIVNTSAELIEKAKNLNLKPDKFINLDMSQVAIKYKCMAPIIISKRMKHYAPLSKGEENKTQFENCMEDLEAAQEYNITTGEFKLMRLVSSQSNGEIRAVIGAYTLYKHDDKPVCDFVLIDISEKRTIDYKTLVAMGSFSLLTALLIPGFGVLELGAVTATVGAYGIENVLMKSQMTKENAEAFLFKTLEHYGVIKFLPIPGQIELITQ